MIVIRQKEFGRVKTANRAMKKAWEAAEGRKIGDKIYKNTGINLGPGDEKHVFRLKNVIDAHGGAGKVIHPKDPSKNIDIASDAVLSGKRNVNHNINTKAIISGPTKGKEPLNKYGDNAIVSDGGAGTVGVNQSRWETMRTGGRQKGKGGVWNEHQPKNAKPNSTSEPQPKKPSKKEALLNKLGKNNEERATNVIAGVGTAGIVAYKVKKKIDRKKKEKEEKDDNSKK